MKMLQIQKKLSGLLAPAGSVYAMLMGVRRKLWECGLRRRLVTSCPCVAVGNISWGGTGKTPMVDWIMGRMLARDIRTVVLTRGYKSHPVSLPMHVNPHHTPYEAGDEPLMLALRHPEGSVLVDPKRTRSAKYALKALKPDLLVLDDGFQHLAVARHLDMVLLRPDDLDEQWDKVIPQGSWREGQSALTRADVFCMKAEPEEFLALESRIRQRIGGLRRPVFSFTLRPTCLKRLDLGAGSADAAPNLNMRPYVLVTGVGNPGQVLDTVTRYMGYAPERHLAFNDHHAYGFNDIKKLADVGIPIVCTAKDAVKLRRMPLSQIWSLQTEVRFGPSLGSRVPFPEWWDSWYVRVCSALAEPVYKKPEIQFAEGCTLHHGPAYQRAAIADAPVAVPEAGTPDACQADSAEPGDTAAETGTTAESDSLQALINSDPHAVSEADNTEETADPLEDLEIPPIDAVDPHRPPRPAIDSLLPTDRPPRPTTPGLPGR